MPQLTCDGCDTTDGPFVCHIERGKYCHDCAPEGMVADAQQRRPRRPRHPDGEAKALDEAGDMSAQRERLYRQQGRTSGGRRF